MNIFKWPLIITWLVSSRFCLKEIIPYSENDAYYKELVENLRELQMQINTTSVTETLAISEPFKITKPKLFPAGQPDLSRIVKLAAASYCSDFNLRSWNCKHCLALGRQVQLINIYSDFLTGTKAILALDHYQKTINVIYRGSSNLRNWLSNLKVGLVQYGNLANVKVHRGFLECVITLKKRILPELKNQIEYHPTYKVSIVGHSLGGAIASISILEFRRALNITDSSLQLVTYGEPRIGNLPFADYFTSQSFPMFRVVHNRDLVPHVPLTIMDFYHRRRMVFIGSNDPYNCDPDNWSDDTCTLAQKIGTSILDHLNYFNTYLGIFC